MFIFDRCHRSSAAETPGKYEHDLKPLNYTLVKSKFPITEKLTDRTLVTPTPGQQQMARYKILRLHCTLGAHSTDDFAHKFKFNEIYSLS